MNNTCSKKNLYTLPVLDKLYKKLYPIAKKTSLSPNTITALNIFLTIILTSIIFLKIPSYVCLPGIILIMILHVILDFFDGCLARTQNKSSKFGKLLDNISDVSYYLIFWLFILYIGFYKKVGTKILLFIAFLMVFALIDTSYRFKSFKHAIDYIFGDYFSINKNKILDVRENVSPFRDNIYLLLICFICPILILVKYYLKL